MMIGPVLRVALMLLLVGCVPDFGIDELRFESSDAGTVEPPVEDAGHEEDAGTADGEPDALVVDSGEHPDALAPDSGEHPDAAPPEICDNGIDDDGDLAQDCADSECTVAVCPDDDLNDCTSPHCTPEGMCTLIGNNAMGEGWECRGTEKHEIGTACQNGLDDDDDTYADCHDVEDCSCDLLGTNLTCCNDGMCRTLCL